MAAAASKYTATSPPAPRNDAGNISGKQHAHHAERVRNAHAQANQREHVQAAVDEGPPPAHEEWPASPQHNRSGQDEFEPLPGSRRRPLHEVRETAGTRSAIATSRTGTVSAAQTQNRRVISTSSGFFSSATVTVRGSRAMPQMGQDPGSSRDDFRMHGTCVFGSCRRRRGDNRLKGHAALRAIAGSLLAHLRVHRAGVFVCSLAHWATGRLGGRSAHLAGNGTSRGRRNLHGMR